MGPQGSEVWHTMLDGAEDILREEGHAALTSRRIAERIGVKQRLVYYYFHTMDDLIVALFRRSSERDLARLQEVSAAPKPLQELWEICFHSHDARLISEYMALANRIPDLRAEVIKFKDYVALKGESGARSAGKLGVEGKEYVVEDGDVMHFRFNV